jgi:hypothetical protein
MKQEESNENQILTYKLRPFETGEELTRSLTSCSPEVNLKLCGNCTRFKRYSNPTATSRRGYCNLKENSVERNESCSFYQEVH